MRAPAAKPTAYIFNVKAEFEAAPIARVSVDGTWAGDFSTLSAAISAALDEGVNICNIVIDDFVIDIMSRTAGSRPTEGQWG